MASRGGGEARNRRLRKRIAMPERSAIEFCNVDTPRKSRISESLQKRWMLLKKSSRGLVARPRRPAFRVARYLFPIGGSRNELFNASALEMVR